jgi:hypothetical protein
MIDRTNREVSDQGFLKPMVRMVPVLAAEAEKPLRAGQIRHGGRLTDA